MDFDQLLQACEDSLEKHCALAESLAEESDRAWAAENKDLCAATQFRFSRLCDHAREQLSPADWHQFRLKVDSLQTYNRPPLV